MDHDRVGWDIVVTRGIGATPQLVAVLARDAPLVIEFEVVGNTKTYSRSGREGAVWYVLLHIAHQCQVGDGVVENPIRCRSAAHECDAV